MQDMLELYVSDLDSSNDIHRIEEAVMAISGVQSASADLRTKMVWVRYDNDQASVRAISHAVEDLGYGISHRPPEPRPGY